MQQKPIEGGYYLIDQPLIRTSIYKHTEELGPEAISDVTVDAVNLIQETPWRINRWSLNVIEAAYNSGLEVGDLPYHDIVTVERKSDEEWETMSDEARKDWKRYLADVHTKNASEGGRRIAFAATMRLASEIQDLGRMYFPHSLDFRGRIYPIPTDLHPQGHDVSKALLEFAEAKALGASGIYYLAIRLANCFGYDKASLDERVKWVFEHEKFIMDAGENPLDGLRWWCEADKPWQLLATCREWYEAHTPSICEKPENYRSRLPVNVDGSCNGLQHLSAMGRDREGAVATNVAANSVRQDIYEQVAERVIERVKLDIVKQKPEATWWDNRVTRKTVKRAVMTTPYGVTSRGIWEQLISDGHCEGMEHKGIAARYMKDLISDALEDTIRSAKRIMSWLQDVAAELSDAGIPFEYTTPSGCRIRQSYYKKKTVKVSTLFGHVLLFSPNKDGDLQTKKQATGSAPNLIHSFDASHLVMTVVRMAERVDGVCFAMIHDSFGCHSCDVDVLSQTLRETFVEIYSDDWLSRLQDDFQALAGSLELPHYKDYISKGDFDVTEVLRSEFFFS